MNEQTIVTPEMIDEELVSQIIRKNTFSGLTTHAMTKVILAYLANNPRVPSVEEARDMQEKWNIGPDVLAANFFSVEWQRHAYLKRAPELPAQLKELFVEIPANGFEERDAAKYHNAAVRKAFEIGLANGGKQ